MTPIPENGAVGRDAAVETALHYHRTVLGSRQNISEKLREEVCGLLRFYNNLFARSDFDLVLSSGDTRMQAETLVQIAKEQNVPIRYFEQGPFGTTLFDVQGVNAKAALLACRPPPIDKVAAYKSHIQRYFSGRRENFSKALTRWDRAWVYLDLLIQAGSLPATASFPLYLRSGQSLGSALGGRLATRAARRKPLPNLTKPYVVLMLQMPQDANFVHYSPIYASFEDIVRDVEAAVPSGHSVVVREHPMMRGQYSAELYEIIEKSPRMILDTLTPLSQVIDDADLIVVNNSTAGLDALARHKRVVVLGESYYNKRVPVYKVERRADLNEVIGHALSQRLDTAGVDEAMADLVLTRFFPGHYQDLRQSGGEEIARFLAGALPSH